jgi:hypothetical protein
MTKQELFVKYHWKQAITLGVATLMVMIFQVGTEEFQSHQLTKQRVLGVTTKQINHQNNKLDKSIILYQNNIKQIIRTYLKQRSSFNKPHQDWLFLINTTRQKIINLATPSVYQDLELQLILLLDKEEKVIKNSQQQELDKFNIKWETLLKQFWWLQ